MSGLRDVLPLIPPLVLGAVAGKPALVIISPNTSLADCRINGSDDASYGTVGWTPNQSGNPFMVLYADLGKDNPSDRSSPGRVPTNQIWVESDVDCFIAIDHADQAANVPANYDDLKVAWVDATRLYIPANRRLQPNAAGLSNIADVRWEMLDWKTMPRKLVLGTPFFGALVMTKLSFSLGVTYEG